MTQGIYRIKVQGILDSNRSEWFDGWEISQPEEGTTILTGPVVDQSALHGILTKLHNLNLPIISVKCIKSK